MAACGLLDHMHEDKATVRLRRRDRWAGRARHQRALDPRAAVAGAARVQRRRAAAVAHAGRPGAPRASEEGFCYEQ